MGGQCHARAELPLGKTRYPLYRRPGGSQSQSAQVWKILPPPGFGPRTVQHVASHYTNYAILAPLYTRMRFIVAVERFVLLLRMGEGPFMLSVDACLMKVYHDGFYCHALRVYAGLAAAVV